MIGNIHSIQTMGAMDGPGIRVVVFMQGCPLRCVYCHNPDTWRFGEGTKFTPKQLVDKILRYKTYISKGGVTISGGEALYQMDFITEVFRILKAEDIHTALDTSGIFPQIDRDKIMNLLKYTDLVLCDIKFSDEKSYKDYCNGNMDTVLDFLELVEKNHTALWIRHVVVPEITDSIENLSKIVEMSHKYSNFEKIEFLPFHKICISKYEDMGIPFPLENVEEMSQQKLDQLIKNIEL